MRFEDNIVGVGRGITSYSLLNLYFQFPLIFSRPNIRGICILMLNYLFFAYFLVTNNIHVKSLFLFLSILSFSRNLYTHVNELASLSLLEISLHKFFSRISYLVSYSRFKIRMIIVITECVNFSMICKSIFE